MKRQRLKPGALVSIDLGDGRLGFGRVLEKSELAFYDRQARLNEDLDLDAAYAAPVAFSVPVMDSAVKSGRWEIIDQRPLEPHFLAPRYYFIQDSISAKYSIYRNVDGATRPATQEECQNLECAAVWSAENIEDRLRAHFGGKAR